MRSNKPPVFRSKKQTVATTTDATTDNMKSRNEGHSLGDTNNCATGDGDCSLNKEDDDTMSSSSLKLLQDMELSVRKLMGDEFGLPSNLHQKSASDGFVFDEELEQQREIFVAREISGYGTKKARICDLHDDEKLKIARLVQKIVQLNKEVGTLRHVAEKESNRSARLVAEIKQWRIKNDQSRNKFGQFLKMFKGYQENILKQEQEKSQSRRQEGLKETEELSHLKEQVQKLSEMLSAHINLGNSCMSSFEDNVNQTQPDTEDKVLTAADPKITQSRKGKLVHRLEDIENELEAERTKMEATLEKSELLRSRFETKLTELVAIRRELHDAIGEDVEKVVDSMPEIRSKAIASRDNTVNNELLLEMSSGLALERSKNERRKGACEEYSNTIDNEFSQQGKDIQKDLFRYRERNTRDLPRRVRNTSVSTNIPENHEAHNTTTNAFSDEDIEMFGNGSQSAMSPRVFENSAFETSLFHIIDQIENESS